MTKDRRQKAEIRARQMAAGTSYMVARRQINLMPLTEGMRQHPN